MLTDNQYDIIRDYVLNKYPSNKIANQQHKSIKVEHAKVKLPYTMMSMDKIKPDTNSLKQFKKTYKGPYVVSCKLDGISALYSTETGTPKMYTRGNGYIGQSIDHLIDYFNLPKTENITLRGEIIIEESKFINNWSSKYANSRNFIAGIVNNREINQERAKMLNDIDFVVYEVISPQMLKPSKQFDYLTTLKPLPNIVNYKILKQDTLTNEVLSQLLLDWRQEYKYNIDGIIVSNDDVYERKDKNPEHAFAFKMVLSEQEAESRVIDILWTASKDGLLKPRIKIEPVVIGGTTINYATGFNAKFIVDNKIE